MAELVTWQEARNVLRDLELRQPVLNGILEVLEVMALDTQRLRDEVAQTQGVNASAVTLLRSVVQSLRDMAQSEAISQTEVNQAADDLDASTNDLASAITENPGTGTDTGTGDGGGGGEPTP